MLPCQWLSGLALKTGRQEVPGSIPGSQVALVNNIKHWKIFCKTMKNLLPLQQQNSPVYTAQKSKLFISKVNASHIINIF